MVIQTKIDGIVTYTHVAYSNDPGGEALQLTEYDDAIYIGAYTDTDEAECYEPAKYEWKLVDTDEDAESDEDEEIETDEGYMPEAELDDQLQDTQGVTDTWIGNSNLLKGTTEGLQNWTASAGLTLTEEDVNLDTPSKAIIATSVSGGILTYPAADLIAEIDGTEEESYTISADIKMSTLCTVPVKIANSDGNNIMLEFESIDNAPANEEEQDTTDVWMHYTSTAETVGVTVSSQNLIIDLSTLPAGATFEIANIKMEGGTEETITLDKRKLDIEELRVKIVTAEYINALKIIAGSVAAENITGDTITGKNIEGGTITGGTVSGATITGGKISGATISGGTVSGAKLTTLKTTSDNSGYQLKASTKEFSFGSILDDPAASQFVISNSGIQMNNGGSGTISMYAKAGIKLSTGGFGAVTIDGKTVSTSGHTHSTLTNSGAVALQAFDGNYTAPDNRAKVRLTVIDSMGYFYPSYNTDGGTSYTQLGGSSHKWRNIYATNGTIQTSDRNMKRDIAELSDKYIELFDALTPVEYKMLEGDRVHTGFIAQDVEDVMTEVGLTAEDFAGFCKDKKEDSDEYIYGLRYEEFIALTVAKIQRQSEQIEELLRRIEKLERS